MRAIFGLCKGLDLCVTAGRHENVAQADAVFAYGAHQGPGILFSKAVPADAVPGVAHWLSRRRNSLRDKNHTKESMVRVNSEELTASKCFRVTPDGSLLVWSSFPDLRLS